MKIRIEEYTCTACELCYDRLPSVFSDRGDGIPIAVLRSPIDDRLKIEIIEIAEDCPSGSIILEFE
ncbi:ferredoxin [Thermocrinis minervae]|uniref:Ferredoxin n=1 Tax=Thermocrinis minervae TaxID=381751 RepID=A0A1M6RK03_9AQUI|nr:ferredoxin [Thermocrinis minervae]SHK32815.1 ferredoxin [Thermocrinis minervae]